MGESGSGKSRDARWPSWACCPRTARISGSVRYRGQNLVGLSDKELTKFRGKNIAMIFQDPMTSR